MVVILMMVVVVMVAHAHLVDKNSQMLQLLRWEVTWLDWWLEDSVHQQGKAGQGACVQSPEKLNSIIKKFAAVIMIENLEGENLMVAPS